MKSEYSCLLPSKEEDRCFWPHEYSGRGGLVSYTQSFDWLYRWAYVSGVLDPGMSAASCIAFSNVLSLCIVDFHSSIFPFFDSRCPIPFDFFTLLPCHLFRKHRAVYHSSPQSYLYLAIENSIFHPISRPPMPSRPEHVRFFNISSANG